MIRFPVAIGKGKVSVSRRKSSTPQKRVVKIEAPSPPSKETDHEAATSAASSIHLTSDSKSISNLQTSNDFLEPKDNMNNCTLPSAPDHQLFPKKVIAAPPTTSLHSKPSSGFNQQKKVLDIHALYGKPKTLDEVISSSSTNPASSATCSAAARKGLAETMSKIKALSSQVKEPGCGASNSVALSKPSNNEKTHSSSNLFSQRGIAISPTVSLYPSIMCRGTLESKSDSDPKSDTAPKRVLANTGTLYKRNIKVENVNSTSQCLEILARAQSAAKHSKEVDIQSDLFGGRLPAKIRNAAELFGRPPSFAPPAAEIFRSPRFVAPDAELFTIPRSAAPAAEIFRIPRSGTPPAVELIRIPRSDTPRPSELLGRPHSADSDATELFSRSRSAVPDAVPPDLLCNSSAAGLPLQKKVVDDIPCSSLSLNIKCEDRLSSDPTMMVVKSEPLAEENILTTSLSSVSTASPCVNEAPAKKRRKVAQVRRPPKTTKAINGEPAPEVDVDTEVATLAVATPKSNSKKCNEEQFLPEKVVGNMPSRSTSTLKRRTSMSDSSSGHPNPKTEANRTQSKRGSKPRKHGDVDTLYGTRNVYESDCTSHTASDTGTLPQGNIPQPSRHACPFRDCSLTFPRPWRLAAHVRRHKGERPYKCDAVGCSRDYTNPAHLRRHVVKNHCSAKVKLSRSMPCPSPGCFMVLASQATLKRHIERRHGPYNYGCHLCDLKFRKQGELRAHMASHEPSSGVLYLCNSCDSGFNDKRLYKKHCRSHRSYPCSVAGCDQVFGVWTKFLKHTKNDHPAAKYVCAECSRVFTVKKNLEFHLETHKEYSQRIKLMCQFRNCNKVYFQQRNLTAHVKRCHCNDTYDCEFPGCTAKLSTKQKRTHHMECVHKLIVPKKERVLPIPELVE